MIEIPFIYTTLLAFRYLIIFGNKREIKLDTLYKFRETILEDVLIAHHKNIENGSSRFLSEADHLDDDAEFFPIDNQEELAKCLIEYEELFYEKDGVLYLRDTYSIEQVELMLRDVEITRTRFHEVIQTKKIFGMLNLTEIIDFKEKIKMLWIELESEIEKSYLENQSSDLVKKNLLKRFSFSMSLAANNPNFIERHSEIPDDELSIPIDENFDYFKESEYTTNNESYPIDYALYENSEFYDIEETYNPIPVCLDDLYQYAIFGSKPLAEYKYCDIISLMSFYTNFGTSNKIDCSVEPVTYDAVSDFDEQQSDNLATINFDIEDEEFAFYITYIHKLNELIALGYSELTNIKNRLLYLLDDVKRCLHVPKNFEIFYQQTLNYELEEDSFEYFENEAKYFIQDVFEGKSDKKLLKLLFTSAYYSITKDEEIIEILNRYKNFENYNEFSKIILGEAKGYSKKKTL